MTDKKRFTEKTNQPTEESVQLFMGDNAWKRLMRFEEMLRERYALNREMRFPFGNADGWGFRYSHKKSLLLYVFFEEDGFCCTISINDAGAKKVEAMLEDLLPEIQTIWINRYPCGASGGWIHYSVVNDDELSDLIRLIGVKVKPQINP
ncbi:hypothetical protein M2454_002961 [Aequitasia blattaphilus]|uniref:DUF3788 family protein n=1 Tax=Aequitasia blattaphilus TaxID=2949332 RepID=A0ABT1ECR6_9FIRM|nr:DUF3788 family protein [Aequitasia blattaphilus]MCP1103617.1 DUF3788 family protein [Aequitasia blattaphilus]MCR8616257.1 DUF3788 family protein [Aequitasia blattaphilus]